MIDRGDVGRGTRATLGPAGPLGPLAGGRVDSPLGPLELLLARDGALVQVRFVDGDYGDFPGASPLSAATVASWRALAPIARQLDDYFDGRRRAFGLDLLILGSPFARSAREAMIAIPFGSTRTYADVAGTLGRPTAARAVGRASALNRLPIVVPCHRLIGSEGGLNGYAGGLELKRWLLAHERRVVERAVALSDPAWDRQTDDAPDIRRPVPPGHGSTGRISP